MGDLGKNKIGFSQMPYQILIVDDEEEICNSLAAILENAGYTTCVTSEPKSAVQIVDNKQVDLVIMDVKMPTLDGIDLLKILKSKFTALPILMMTGFPSVDSAVEAMKYGATNFYVKPPKIPQLLAEIQQLASSRNESQTRLPCKNEMITENDQMIRILKDLEKAAPTQAPVLVTGESGTGKELAGNALHSQSGRKDQPFLKINCAALPENLLESELFGHERGAFTSAVAQRKGKFELAHNGTLFLDEVGDMSLTTQAKILRVIQEQKFERVGGSETLETNVRIVAATNKNIQDLISKGLFREDLYYRLSVISIHLPPIRERIEDILLLAHHFLLRYAQQYNKPITDLSEEAQQFFKNHSWPGNVREIKNCIERAVIFCEGEQLQLADLSNQYKDLATNSGSRIQNYESSLEQLNREMILDALSKSHGVKQEAAKILNINRRTLYNRMKKLGLE